MIDDKRQQIQSTAKLIAMFVRDGIEDFHCENLSNGQMAVLNPLIRNAIYTALYAMEHMTEDWRCDRLVDEKSRAVPQYWEEPELWSALASPQEKDEEVTRYFKRLHAEKYGLPIEDV